MNPHAQASAKKPVKRTMALPAVAEEVPVLRYPLTKKALSAAFVELAPESISITKIPGHHDASVHGEWSLSRLTAHFKMLGFKPVGKKDQLLFSNDSQTVGFRLQGMSPKPNSNTWRTYYIEVEARPLSAVGRVQRGTVLWG